MVDFEVVKTTSLEPLTIDRILELWSKTYNTEGKPDWSHLYPYYHDQIIFEDSIQRIDGIEAFKEMCKRLTKRCEQLNMEILSIVMDANIIFFQWKMTMMFTNIPALRFLVAQSLRSVKITKLFTNEIFLIFGERTLTGFLIFGDLIENFYESILANKLL